MLLFFHYKLFFKISVPYLYKAKSLTSNVDKNNFSYNLDSSQNVTVKNINNKLGVLTPSTFTVKNKKKAVFSKVFFYKVYIVIDYRSWSEYCLTAGLGNTCK